MSGGSPGKPALQIRAELKERALSQQMTVRCADCKWYFRGEAGLAIESAKSHRRHKHPERPERAKLQGSRSNMKGIRKEVPEHERDEIERERARRAFLNGVELE